MAFSCPETISERPRLGPPRALCYNELMPNPKTAQPSRSAKPTTSHASRTLSSRRPTPSHSDWVDRLVLWGCRLLHLEAHAAILQQLAKFVIVGVINTAIDWILYFILDEFFHINPLIANIFSFTASTTYSYFASMSWVFHPTREKTRRRLFVEFVILNLIALGLTEILLFVMIDQFTWDSMLAKIISTFITMIFNFITRKLFIEGKRPRSAR